MSKHNFGRSKLIKCECDARPSSTAFMFGSFGDNETLDYVFGFDNNNIFSFLGLDNVR